MSTVAHSNPISVVIPCYRQAHFLAQAIDSALQQTLGAPEVIVVNDGSPDDTAAVARRYGDRIIYLERPNGGLSAARNTGLASATREFVQFLDADDYLAPDMHAESLAVLAAHPAAAGTYCGFSCVDRDGRLLRAEAAAPEEPDEFHRLLRGNPWPCHTVIVRRALLPSAPVFDEALRSCEDWDLWLRVTARGASFRRVEHLGAFYRRSGSSMSSQSLTMYRTSLDVIRRHAARHACPQCAPALRQGEEVVWECFGRPAVEAPLATHDGGAWLRACLACARLDPRTFRAYVRSLRHRKRTVASALLPWSR